MLQREPIRDVSDLRIELEDLTISGSASTANTLCPARASISASAPAMVDFPTPPLPEIAIFIVRRVLRH
jgi:hypothetical protein